MAWLFKGVMPPGAPPLMQSNDDDGRNNGRRGNNNRRARRQPQEGRLEDGREERVRALLPEQNSVQSPKPYRNDARSACCLLQQTWLNCMHCIRTRIISGRDMLVCLL